MSSGFTLSVLNDGPSASRVLFVNIPAITAELLGAALTEQGAVDYEGAAHHPAAVSAHLKSHTPEIAVVGSQPGREQPTGLAFIEQIRMLSPQTRPIVLGHYLSGHDEVALLYAGARGLLNESETTVSILAKCIRAVAAGQVWANSRQLDQLLASLSMPRTLRVRNVMGNVILSRREEEVLQLLSEGMSNRDLAATLKLSEHTVKNHLFHIFDKLGVSSRMEAVIYAMSQRAKPRPPAAHATAEACGMDNVCQP